MGKLSIRCADLNDVALLTRLRVEFLNEIGDPVSDEEEHGLFDSIYVYMQQKIARKEFLSWIAEIDGEIVGTSGLVFFERPPQYDNITGIEAYIMNMYTLPAWRRQGIAQALLQEIYTYIHTTPAKRIWLHATKDGKPLYEKEGFTLNQHTTEMEKFWQ